jgi:hypothetical protein
MGWTFTHVEKGASVSEFFANQFNYTREDGSYGKVLLCKSTPHEAYIAYERKLVGQEPEVTAIVCLIHRVKAHFNFGYKDMDETMQPYYYNCPKEVLALLTPTTNMNAQVWRNECANNNAQKVLTKALKKGDVVEFDTPFNFKGYGKAAIFTVLDIKKSHYYAQSLGITVKLTKSSVANRSFVVL